MGFFANLGIGGGLFEASQAAKQSRKAIKALPGTPTSPTQTATVNSIIATAVPANLITQFRGQAKRLFQAQGRAISTGTSAIGASSTDATRSGGRVARLLKAQRDSLGTTARGEEGIATLKRDVGVDRLGKLAGASRLESGQQIFRETSDLLRKELFQAGRAKVGRAVGGAAGSAIAAFAGGG